MHASVPGTARRFVVHHPASTDPALSIEVLVAYQELHPTIDNWTVIRVGG